MPAGIYAEPLWKHASYKDIAQEMASQLKRWRNILAKHLQVLRNELKEEKLVSVAVMLISALSNISNRGTVRTRATVLKALI